MFSAARILLPVSVSVLVAIYNYSRQKSEFSEGVEVPLNPTSVPSPAPSDLYHEILDWIRTLDPAVLNRIRNPDPALLHEIQQFNPAVEIRNLDPSIVDRIRNLDPAFPSEFSESVGVPQNPPSVPSPEPSVVEIPDWIGTLGPAVLDEDRSFDPSIVDGIRKLSLKEKEEKAEEEKERETEKEKENEKEREGKERKQQQQRRQRRKEKEEAGDCRYYLRNGNCKFGSNCKYNHPRSRKNKQVPRERVKDKDESAENPSQTECKYYLNSGGCKENCRYSHSKGKLELNFLGLPIRPGKRECPYYVRNGSCKYALNCSLNHPDPTATRGSDPPSGYGNGGPASLQGASQSTVAPWSAPRPLNEDPVYSTLMIPPPKLELNFLGLPIRPGKRECPYYVRNGSCKYALNCRLNHPDPTATGGSDPPSGYGNGGPASLQGASQSTVAPWSAPRPLNEDPVYSTLMIPPPQVVSSQNSERNGYQASAYAPERSMPACLPYMMNNSVAETNIYKQHPHQNQVEEFPERPGQPLCSSFLRKGYCRLNLIANITIQKLTAVSPPIALCDKGLPLRPDQNICTHYSRYGICKFGPACKFDHPLHISSSSTSGPDHQLPFSDSPTTNGAGMAGSRNRADITSQPQPVQ